MLDDCQWYMGAEVLSLTQSRDEYRDEVASLTHALAHCIKERDEARDAAKTALRALYDTGISHHPWWRYHSTSEQWPWLYEGLPKSEWCEVSALAFEELKDELDEVKGERDEARKVAERVIDMFPEFDLGHDRIEAAFPNGLPWPTEND